MSEHKSYIVTFKDSATDQEIEKHLNDIAAAGGQGKPIGGTLIKAIAGSIPESHLENLKGLSGANGIIERIEEDKTVTTQ